MLLAQLINKHMLHDYEMLEPGFLQRRPQAYNIQARCARCAAASSALPGQPGSWAFPSSTWSCRLQPSLRMHQTAQETVLTQQSTWLPGWRAGAGTRRWSSASAVACRRVAPGEAALRVQMQGACGATWVPEAGGVWQAPHSPSGRTSGQIPHPQTHSTTTEFACTVRSSHSRPARPAGPQPVAPPCLLKTRLT